MTRVLYIVSNPKQVEDSVSCSVGKAFLDKFKKKNPNDEIIELNLFNMEIPELDSEVIKFHAGIPVTDPATQKKVDKIDQFTQQLIDADIYIFATPLWNLGLPARVKSYIDAICIAGKTFSYTPNGPVGLLRDKKCIHFHASGGFHSNDPQNHADGYLKDIMSFLGVKEYKSVVIEGHMAFPDKAEEIIDAAKAKIPELLDWLS